MNGWISFLKKIESKIAVKVFGITGAKRFAKEVLGMVAEKRIVGKSVCNQRENRQKEYNDARMGTNRTRINSNREKRQQIYRFAIDTFILGVLFATVAYQAIPWAVRYESDFEYCLLWIVSLIMGVFTKPPTKYSSATIVGIIIIVPYALDCIMAYHRERFSLVLLLCLLGMCSYFIMVIWQCYPVVRTGRNRKKWPQYLIHFVYRSKILMTGILLAMLVVFSITGLISNYVVQREQETNVSTEKINSILSTMDNNAEIVSNLDAGRWNTLSRDR